MVYLYHLAVLKKEGPKAVLLSLASDLTSFGYFQRRNIQEFMEFTSRMLVERTIAGARSSIKQGEYLCHVYTQTNNLAAVLITDLEYPQRVAQTILNKVLEDFANNIPVNQRIPNEPSLLNFRSTLENYLNKYKNPLEADALTRIQNDVDETKIILHQTLESVLQRGEKLDDLVAKSEDLSRSSKHFYKAARKTNSCCKL
ncbi:YKT6 [Cordylochernes scorpioides]|uniref:YKT6 n=1 Tax=Cordylochernes scorpioides TaxID=51811 RepID=A0ABY6K647_9ARAC|nr:YKT6 [Cordylochernes scorpioides]